MLITYHLSTFVVSLDLAHQTESRDTFNSMFQPKWLVL